jgi:hypothetical protein
MKLDRTVARGLSMLLAVAALWGCGGDLNEQIDVATGAATSVVTLNATAFGNWAQNGVRTSNEYLTGTVGGVEHAGYFVFDLSSVAGRTLTGIELVLNNASSGFRENITSPKPGLRVPFRPIGTTTISHLTTGNNDTNVYQQIRKDTEDYSYFYIQSATGSTRYGLLGYDTDRIPAIVKSATKGTLFAVAGWPSNVNRDTKVISNGTGDQFVFKGITTTPQLRLTLQ